MSTLRRGRQTTLLLLAGALAAASVQAAPALRAAGTARLLTIAGDGYAGSSVNVVAGLQNSIVTEKGALTSEGVEAWLAAIRLHPALAQSA